MLILLSFPKFVFMRGNEFPRKGLMGCWEGIILLLFFRSKSHQLLPPVRELWRTRSFPPSLFFSETFKPWKNLRKKPPGIHSPFWIEIPHPDQDKFRQSGLTKTRISPEHPQKSGSCKGKVYGESKAWKTCGQPHSHSIPEILVSQALVHQNSRL